MYSRHLILFLTYEWAQYARVLHYTRLEKLAEDKHYSLLGPFMSYERKWGIVNKVLPTNSVV